MRDTTVLPLYATEMRVPLFYFHVLNDDWTEDGDGIDFPDAAAARREAIQAAGHILSDSEHEIHDGTPWIMRVMDASGNIVCNLQFSTTTGC